MPFNIKNNVPAWLTRQEAGAVDMVAGGVGSLGCWGMVGESCEPALPATTTVMLVVAVTLWPEALEATRVYVMVLVGVTVAVPEIGFRLPVLTAGGMLIVDAPVTVQDRALDWPARMVGREAEKELIVGRLMVVPPPPPPPPLGGAVTVTVVW